MHQRRMPQQTGLDAPIIIIFGARLRPDGSASATMRRRVEAAMAFGGATACYVPTGGACQAGMSEAAAMRGILVAMGVPPARILVEPTARDTLDSVLACAALLRGGTAVHAASSSYHLPRCMILLRMAGLPVRRCPPPAEGAQPFWWAREALALPWDVLQMWRRLQHR